MFVKLYFQLVPGPPFVFGALLVICALLVAAFIPESNTMSTGSLHHPSTSRRPSGKYAYQKCTLQVVKYAKMPNMFMVMGNHSSKIVLIPIFTDTLNERIEGYAKSFIYENRYSDHYSKSFTMFHLLYCPM